MFCCTKSQRHSGEIVTTACLQPECIRYNNQLSCCLCLQQQHQGHSTTPLKTLIPQLLAANDNKYQLKAKIDKLLQFIWQQFGKVNQNQIETSDQNIVQRVIELLLDLKQQVQFNTEEVNKMKSIFKVLNKNSQQSIFHPSSTVAHRGSEEEMSLSHSPQKNPSKSSLSSFSPMLSQLPMQTAKSQFMQANSPIFALDQFSHMSKHPHINISASKQTVVKVSHSGHRFAVVGGKALSDLQNQLRVRIDKSNSGNILIGLCHQSIVRSKEFTNCYGMGNGTYLIGQNGNNPSTAICFHHSVNFLNRKEIVGWNFQQSDTIIIGIKYDQRRNSKKPSTEFVMNFSSEHPKPEMKKLLEQGFKFIVLLQSQGDQVTLSEP